MAEPDRADVRIMIDTIVLDGIDIGDPEAFRAEFTAALAGLAAGFPAGHPGGAAPVLHGAPIAVLPGTAGLAAGTAPDGAGARVAASVWGSMVAPGRGGSGISRSGSHGPSGIGPGGSDPGGTP